MSYVHASMYECKNRIYDPVKKQTTTKSHKISMYQQYAILYIMRYVLEMRQINEVNKCYQIMYILLMVQKSCTTQHVWTALQIVGIIFSISTGLQPSQACQSSPKGLWSEACRTHQHRWFPLEAPRIQKLSLVECLQKTTCFSDIYKGGKDQNNIYI